MQDVGVRFSGSATGAVGAARETATAIAGVRHEANTLSPSLRTVERDTGKMSRGMLAGTGAIGGLGRSVAFASFSFLGGAGLIAGIKSAYEQAETANKAIDSLSVVIRRNGGDVRAATPLIRQWANEQKQYGISASEAMQGLARSAAITGSVQRAQVAYNEALIISKATGKDFNAVLIAASKAQIGQTSALARYIGTVPKGTTSQQLLNRVMARYEGQAKANTSTSDRLHASLSNIELKIGRGLLPVFEKYGNELDRWLSKSKNQREITHDVSAAVRGLQGVFHAAGVVIHNVDRITGGFENTMETLIGLAVASKIGGWSNALKAFIGSEAAGSGVAGASAETGLLNKRLRLLRALTSKPFQFLVVWSIVRKITGSGADFSQGTASDSTITVNGKRYVIGSSSAYQALLDAGWRPPRGVNIGNITAAQEIGAAKSLGGSGHIAGRGDGTRPSHAAGRGIVGTARWAAAQPGASTSYQFGGRSAIGKGTHTDCSGFTQAVYRANGIQIPRNSQAQYSRAPQHPKRSQLVPGDLVFFNYEGPHSHVGIYVGGGRMIGDQHTGSGIVNVGMDWAHYDGAASYSKMPRGGGGGGGGGDGSVFGTHAPPVTSTAATSAKPAFKVPVSLQNQIRRAQARFASDMTKANLDALLKLYEEEDRLARQHGAVQPAIGEIAAAKRAYRAHLKALAAKAARQAAKVAAATIDRIDREATGPENTLQLAQAAGASVSVILADQKALLAAYEDEAARLRRKLAKSTGQAKAEYKAALDRINGLISSTQDGIVGSIQSLYQVAAERVNTLLGEIETAADTALGAKYFQGGLQTPAEAALAAMQAQDTASSLQDALAQAQQQLQADTGAGASPAVIAADQAAISSANRAIEENNLAIQAAKERADADSDYAKAVFNLNQALESAPQTVAGVTTVLGEFGLTLSGLVDPGGNGLLDQFSEAVSAAADALNDLTVAAGGKPAKGGKGGKGGGTTGAPPGSPPPPPMFAAGGLVPGPRYVHRDAVPAFLTPGEYVLNRRVTDALEQLAAGGGSVSRSAAALSQRPIYVLGTTRQEVARALARVVSPAQDRRISFPSP
jgi:cell wall-associated NlpC family hydrolase